MNLQSGDTVRIQWPGYTTGTVEHIGKNGVYIAVNVAHLPGSAGDRSGCVTFHRDQLEVIGERSNPQ